MFNFSAGLPVGSQIWQVAPPDSPCLKCMRGDDDVSNLPFLVGENSFLSTVASELPVVREESVRDFVAQTILIAIHVGKEAEEETVFEDEIRESQCLSQ